MGGLASDGFAINHLCLGRADDNSTFLYLCARLLGRRLARVRAHMCTQVPKDLYAWLHLWTVLLRGVAVWWCPWHALQRLCDGDPQGMDVHTTGCFERYLGACFEGMDARME